MHAFFCYFVIIALLSRMLIQWTVILCLACTVLSNDVQDDSSTQSPSASTTEPPVEITSQKSYQEEPIEAKIVQKLNAARNFGISSIENPFSYNVDPIVNNNPGVITAGTAPVERKTVTAESQQYVTVTPPTTNRVSSIPVPVIPQPIRHYAPTVLNPAIQYISVPVGYYNVFKSQDQFVDSQQLSGVFEASSLPRPLPASFNYYPRVLYVSDPTRTTQSPSIYQVATKKQTVENHQSVTAHPPSAPSPSVVSSPTALHPSYNRIQEIINRFPAQRVSLPTAKTDHHLKTVNIKPSSSEIVTAPVTVSPISEQHIPSQTIQYITVPIKQVETHQSILAYPPRPSEAPMYNVQVIANPPPAQLFNPSGTSPVTSTTGHSTLSINHRALPHVNYASSSTVAKPIPVSVIHSAEGSPSIQLDGLPKDIQPAVTKVSHPAPASFSQRILVPVVYSNSAAQVNYDNKHSSPVVYMKTVADKDRDYSVPTQNLPVYSYKKAVTFSPASEVSRVRYNGDGINYSW